MRRSVIASLVLALLATGLNAALIGTQAQAVAGARLSMATSPASADLGDRGTMTGGRAESPRITRLAAATGHVRVVFLTPRGVPASLVLNGKTRTAVTKKDPQDRRSRITVRVKPGAYRVKGTAAIVNGKRYVAKVSAARLRVTAGKRTTITVRMLARKQRGRFQATTVTATQVALQWTLPKKGVTSVLLRRAAGGTPPARLTSGTKVAVVKGAAARHTDAGLVPSRDYSYSLFARTKGGWSKPLTLNAHTAAAAGPRIAYVKKPGALLVSPGTSLDVAIGNGTVLVNLGNRWPVPDLGAGVILPISDDLPGGYVGTVAEVLPDGHRLRLADGGLPDVFDYLSIDADLATTLTHVTELPPSEVPLNARGMAKCAPGGGAQVALKNLSVVPEGHLRYTLDSWFSVPVAVNLDTRVAARYSVTADLAAKFSGSCYVGLPKLVVSGWAGPVPLAFKADNGITISANGTLELPGAQFSLTQGAWSKARFGLSPYVIGGPVYASGAAPPKAAALSGSVGLKYGVDMTFGIGQATGGVGAMAGLNGHLNVIQADFTAKATSTGQVCGSLDAKSSAGLALKAQAWAGALSAAATLAIPGLNGGYQWPGYPHDIPRGCAEGNSTPTPTQVPGSWSSLTAGGAHSCGVKTDGTAWCWGDNVFGQLGDGTTTDRWTPAQVPGSWSSLTAGGAHSCGVKTDGTAWCWGNNGVGQLGDGLDNSQSSTPIQVPGSWSSLTAGGHHSCGVKTDGTAWCWGANWAGQLGDGTTTDRWTPTQVPGSWSSLTAGGAHSCGAKTDGTAWCWGHNGFGELGDGTTTDRWTPTQVPGSWSSVTAGGAHSCGVKTDGTAWCWGHNGFGELGDGTTTDRTTPYQVPGPWTRLTAGSWHTCGVNTDSTAWCWGNDRG
jgi:hypothetical protein